jgi:hypothetical protein
MAPQRPLFSRIATPEESRRHQSRITNLWKEINSISFQALGTMVLSFKIFIYLALCYVSFIAANAELNTGSELLPGNTVRGRKQCCKVFYKSRGGTALLDGPRGISFQIVPEFP